MEEPKGANPQESPPETIEGAIASSPEAISEAQEVVTETPTPQEGETPPVKKEQGETPLHEQPRFKEVIDEKNWYKQQLEQQMARQQQPPQQPQQPADPYAGMDAETARFYQNMDTRIEQKAKQILQTNVTPQIQQGIEEIARLRVEQFRKDHSDVKASSPEEMQIAQKIRSGYLPEDAYRAVMWDKKVGEKRTTNTQQQQQRLDAKRQANVVSPNSVSQASVPPKKETFKEELARKMNTDWNGEV